MKYRHFKKIHYITLFLVFLPILGFFIFCLDAFRPTTSPLTIPHNYDAIIVLTGGRDRIPASFQLLQQIPPRPLLISGVGAHTHLQQILTHSSTSLPAPLIPNVTLGYQATSTVENAQESSSWALTHHFHHIILITAGYHMRRALIEFHNQAPNLTLIPFRVRSPASLFPFHWQTIILLALEYAKYSAVLIKKYTHEPFIL